MTELGNLIDLSLDGEERIGNEIDTSASNKEEFRKEFSTNSSVFNNAFFIKDLGRPSLDNNPFDRVQKLASREMDPFDMVEKEASMKAREAKMPSQEVKLGNLLSLSDENLTRFEDESIENGKNKGNAEMVAQKSFEESPTTNMSGGSEMSSSSASDSGGGGARSKKSLDLRNRLLKLTLTNSTYNSPVNRKLQFNPKDSEDDLSSPLSSVFAEAAQLSESLLGSESPLKLVDDDLMLEELPDLLKNDFEADLEMLKIPILNKLHSPQKKTEFEKEESKCSKNIDKLREFGASAVSDHLNKLEALKAKLNFRKAESSDNEDVEQLIESLKKLIIGIDDEKSDKRLQAASLLKTLSASLTKKEKRLESGEAEKASLNIAPIKRQGTFDIDLQNEIENKSFDPPKIVIDSVPTIQSLESNPKIENIPDCMFRSSATYDGETTDEKRDYILPEVEPLTDEPLSPIQPDVNDIFEQISKLLEQHQMAQQSQNNPLDVSAMGNAGVNPTVIVFMNTSTVGQLPNIPNRRSFCYSNDNCNESTSDSQTSSSIRRRSQSLSIHDKVKILSLPTPKSPISPKPEKLSTSAVTDIGVKNINNLKTPSKMLSRRNSFSNATSSYSANHMAMSAKKAAEVKLTAVSEQNRHAIVRPLPPMPTKRKVGSKTESIVKSNGPLKATIPMKKVAPTLQVKSPLHEKRAFAPPETPANQNRVRNFSSSIKMKSKQREVPLTSTPMPRNGNLFNLPTPHSSSIQALNVMTPLKKDNPQTGLPKSIVKPRYSSATPNTLKTNVSSVVTTGLKRRSLTELKEKSPVKSRSNARNLSLASSSSMAASTRTNSKLPATSNGRLSTRLSLRPGTSNANPRNKENKRP